MFEPTVVELEVVLTLFLGVVHREVGVHHQRGLVERVIGEHRDADAGGDAALLRR